MLTSGRSHAIFVIDVVVGRSVGVRCLSVSVSLPLVYSSGEAAAAGVVAG